MYLIEEKNYGYKLTFSGPMEKTEMEQWVSDSEKLLKDKAEEFSVFVDLTQAKPIDAETRHVMTLGQKLYKSKGMHRSAVILSNTIATLQFKKIAQRSGIYEGERYIDASQISEWEEKGLQWVKEGVDPELNPQL